MLWSMHVQRACAMYFSSMLPTRVRVYMYVRCTECTIWAVVRMFIYSVASLYVCVPAKSCYIHAVYVYDSCPLDYAVSCNIRPLPPSPTPHPTHTHSFSKPPIILTSAGFKIRCNSLTQFQYKLCVGVYFRHH